MKPLNTILAAMLVAAAARGEVLIYNQSYTQTTTGQGGVTISHFTGNVICDDSGNLMQLDVDSKAKTFKVWDYSADWDVHYLRSSLTTKQMLVFVPMGDNGGMFFKGAALSTFTGTTNLNTAKAFTMSGTFYSGTDPDAYAYEFKGVATFNSKTTIAANQSGNDINTAMDSLKAALRSKGYTEL